MLIQTGIMKKSLTILLLSVMVLTRAWGQDPQFSQFYSSLLYLSPAFAGSKGGDRLVMNMRDQWLKLPGTYMTGAVSYDHYFPAFKSGVGVLLFQDMAGGGLLNTTNAGLMYSFMFEVTPIWQIRTGLQFYYTTRGLNFNKLTFNDQLSRDYIKPSSIEILENQRIGHFDFTSSAMAFSEYFWFGVTVDHMMSYSPVLKNEMGYLPIRYSTFAGARYLIARNTLQKLEESVSLSAHFMIQDKYKYLDMGAHYLKERLVFGLWFRGLPIFKNNPNAGAISLLGGYKFDMLSIGYSYDFSMSKLITKTGGAHEVSVSYSLFPDNKRHRRMKMVPCPDF